MKKTKANIFFLEQIFLGANQDIFTSALEYRLFLLTCQLPHSFEQSLTTISVTLAGFKKLITVTDLIKAFAVFLEAFQNPVLLPEGFTVWLNASRPILLFALQPVFSYGCSDTMLVRRLS